MTVSMQNVTKKQNLITFLEKVITIWQNITKQAMLKTSGLIPRPKTNSRRLLGCVYSTAVDDTGTVWPMDVAASAGCQGISLLARMSSLVFKMSHHEPKKPSQKSARPYVLVVMAWVFPIVANDGVHVGRSVGCALNWSLGSVT